MPGNKLLDNMVTNVQRKPSKCICLPTFYLCNAKLPQLQVGFSCLNGKLSASLILLKTSRSGTHATAGPPVCATTGFWSAHSLRLPAKDDSLLIFLGEDAGFLVWGRQDLSKSCSEALLRPLDLDFDRGACEDLACRGSATLLFSKESRLPITGWCSSLLVVGQLSSKTSTVTGYPTIGLPVHLLMRETRGT